MACFKLIRPVLFGVLSLAPLVNASAADGIYRFDMGTEKSPVAAGYQRVDAASQYTKDKGFGWVGDSERTSFYRTEISPLVVWKHDPPPTLMDGVQSKDDLMFRIDVPNGRYTVEAYVGDLGGYLPAGMGRFLDTGVPGDASGGPGGPLFSMGLASGDRTIAVPIETRTLPHRGVAFPKELSEALGEKPRDPNAKTVYVRLGNYQRIRFDEQAADGALKLKFFGDDTAYRKGVDQLKAISDRRERNEMTYVAGGPFTANSVLAIVVRPALVQPLIEENGKLRAAAGANSPLAPFVAAFNSADFRTAGESINKLPSSNFEERQARILARMWLIGHPNQYREREALPTLLKEINAALEGAKPAEKAELLSLQEDALDLQRGTMNFDQRTKDGQEVVPSMNRAEGYFARARQGGPFYWKSQLYRARIWYSMDPNRNAQLFRKSELIIRDLEKVYPENRWVRYYLHEDASGWPVKDYRAETRSAPEWASELHNFYNRMLDLSDWWISTRQDPVSGALGGEWGDDVEIMPLFGYTAFICPDASPAVLEGARNFCEGVWSKSGIIDPHNGFFHITSDAEHASEFTGNVLGMMSHLNPGDPTYVERSMMTSKLMRDLWMGKNDKGQRILRSGYLGAFHVPNSAADVDAAITGRAFNPAWSVLELNRNPEIARLAIEYADTLTELAMSTEKGKPKGVLPGPIVYETGELGYPGSKEWWLAPDDDFQQMFSFPDYHGFRLQVLGIAWRLTKNKKYLEPIRLEAELVKTLPPRKDSDGRRRRRRDDGREDQSEKGSPEWTARQLAQFNVVKMWDDIQAEMAGGTDPETTGPLLNKDEVAAQARKLSDVARNRWPMMTDDGTMTDRLGFSSCSNSTAWYSGARLDAQEVVPAITYDGPGRDFAALVLRHNPKYMKFLYYGFHEEPRRVNLHFWEIQPSGTYRLTGGPDANGDDTADKIEFDQEFVLNEPSGGIELTLPPDSALVFEIRQLQSGNSGNQAPDPAISKRDILFDPRGHILVDVHNIGNLPAKDVAVEIYEGDPAKGGKLLGRTIVSNIEPPNNLQPQVVRTGVVWKPGDKPQEITVVLDRENRIKELFERNNKATATISAVQTR